MTVEATKIGIWGVNIAASIPERIGGKNSAKAATLADTPNTWPWVWLEAVLLTSVVKKDCETPVNSAKSGETISKIDTEGASGSKNIPIAVSKILNFNIFCSGVSFENSGIKLIWENAISRPINEK